jgi:hypothetical protein
VLVHETYEDTNQMAVPRMRRPARNFNSCTSHAVIEMIPKMIEPASATPAGTSRNQCGVRLRRSSSCGWR